jgi:hypothetical protein
MKSVHATSARAEVSLTPVAAQHTGGSEHTTWSFARGCGNVGKRMLLAEQGLPPASLSCQPVRSRAPLMARQWREGGSSSRETPRSSPLFCHTTACTRSD